MYHEIANKLTPLPESDFILAVAQAWAKFYNSGPEARQLACCLAQMLLESGRVMTSDGWVWGKFAHNYNWGNIKHNGDGDPHNWQYYQCGEEVLLSTASATVAKSGGLVSIVRSYNSGGKAMASVVIKPNHPWCRFRAFDTALEGTLDYLGFLVGKTRYQDAWNLGVLKGNPAVFAQELGQHGYYTAPISIYTAMVIKIFNEIQPKVVNILQSADGQAIYEGLQSVERERLINLTSTVMEVPDNSLDNAGKDMSEDDLRSTLTPNDNS